MEGMDLKNTAQKIVAAAAVVLHACVPAKPPIEMPEHPRGGTPAMRPQGEPAGESPPHKPGQDPLIAPPPGYGNKIVRVSETLEPAEGKLIVASTDITQTPHRR